MRYFSVGGNSQQRRKVRRMYEKAGFTVTPVISGRGVAYLGTYKAEKFPRLSSKSDIGGVVA